MKSNTAPATGPSNDRKTIWVFTPSRTDPKDLEFILVQRQKLLQDAVERVKESALTEHKHHLLFVGPRGCGKTHLVTLIVSRLGDDDELTDRLRIAWLNEDETCTTVLEFLVKIHSALEKRYPAEYREEILRAAYDMKQDAALEFVSARLLDSLGSRTLLVVTENLDAIFEGLQDAGQKQLRSFIQENPRLSIVATAQRLVEDLSDRTSPFFGFFQTEHLKPLDVEQATELLQNIARLQGKGGVVEFLATGRGRSRVRAIHHLSGGNHRIYIVLSQFITRDSVDALLEPFMKMVDELTPYYQERIRWLPPLQRKIVEYLCVCEGTVPVKEIAKRLFATPQTISSQLQDLREKGYVEANQRGRESLYEISEPLMRICVEVKDNQRHQPLRLLVAFLRVWYEDHELKNRLGTLEPSSAACEYLRSAIQRNSVEGNLRKQILLDDICTAFPDEFPAAIRDGVIPNLDHVSETMLVAIQSAHEGKPEETIRYLNEAINEEATPKMKVALLHFRAEILSSLGERASAIADYTAMIDLPDASVEQVAIALVGRGITHGESGDTKSQIDDYTAVIDLPDAPVKVVAKSLLNRGSTHAELGNVQQGNADYTAVIGLPGAPIEQVAKALLNRGIAQWEAGEVQSAIADYTALIVLPSAPVEHVASALVVRGAAHWQTGGTESAISDYTAVIDLPGAPIAQVAMALIARGLTQGEAADAQRAISDFTAAVALPDAPVEQVAMALSYRGVIQFNEGQQQESQADFEALIRLPAAPVENVVDAHLALSSLHFSEGRWSEGFQSLEAGLECGERVQPVYRGTATDLIGVVFTAGLSPEGRREKVQELLRAYDRHQALSVLGEAVIQHVGNVFREGAPFPSSDNLDGWALAWEKSAESVPDFRLSVRLLLTGIDYIKSGGKDPGILLNLTAPERAILKQALGLTTTR